MNDLTIVWIIAFGFIYIFFYSKEEQLWKVIGSGMLFINGILGVQISDHLITSFIMYITFIIMIKEIVKTIMIATDQ